MILGRLHCWPAKSPSLGHQPIRNFAQSIDLKMGLIYDQDIQCPVVIEIFPAVKVRKSVYRGIFFTILTRI